jgi:hypothetical protein
MKTDRSEEWKALRQKVNDHIGVEAAVLARFASMVQELFKEMIARINRGEEPGIRTDTTLRFKRKPNVSLRLIADGEPPAKLITMPYWSRHSGKLSCDVLTCELLTEETVQTAHGPGKRRQLLFSAMTKDGIWISTRIHADHPQPKPRSGDGRYTFQFFEGEDVSWHGIHLAQR